MRTPDQIEAELKRLEAAIGWMVSNERDDAYLAYVVLRDRLSPGQVQTAYGNRTSDEFEAAMAAATWAAGWTDARPGAALL